MITRKRTRASVCSSEGAATVGECVDCSVQASGSVANGGAILNELASDTRKDLGRREKSRTARGGRPPCVFRHTVDKVAHGEARTRSEYGRHNGEHSPTRTHSGGSVSRSKLRRAT